jgi:Fur family ferric uptake transcriptional regulator
MLLRKPLHLRLKLETGRSGYYSGAAQHHHHLVCSICAVVVNIGNCELEELEKRVSEHTGFKIISHTFDISGICPECQNGKIKTSGVKI